MNHDRLDEALARLTDANRALVVAFARLESRIGNSTLRAVPVQPSDGDENSTLRAGDDQASQGDEEGKEVRGPETVVDPTPGVVERNKDQGFSQPPYTPPPFLLKISNPDGSVAYIDRADKPGLQTREMLRGLETEEWMSLIAGRVVHTLIEPSGDRVELDLCVERVPSAAPSPRGGSVEEAGPSDKAPGSHLPGVPVYSEGGAFNRPIYAPLASDAEIASGAAMRFKVGDKVVFRQRQATALRVGLPKEGVQMTVESVDVKDEVLPYRCRFLSEVGNWHWFSENELIPAGFRQGDLVRVKVGWSQGVAGRVSCVMENSIISPIEVELPSGRYWYNADELELVPAESQPKPIDERRWRANIGGRPDCERVDVILRAGAQVDDRPVDDFQWTAGLDPTDVVMWRPA